MIGVILFLLAIGHDGVAEHVNAMVDYRLYPGLPARPGPVGRRPRCM